MGLLACGTITKYYESCVTDGMGMKRVDDRGGREWETVRGSLLPAELRVFIE